MADGTLAVLVVFGVAVALASLINPNFFGFLASLLDRLRRSREPQAFSYHGLAREEVLALSIDDIDTLDQLIRTELFADGRAALMFLQLATRGQVDDAITNAAEMREQQRSRWTVGGLICTARIGSADDPGVRLAGWAVPGDTAGVLHSASERHLRGLPTCLKQLSQPGEPAAPQ